MNILNSIAVISTLSAGIVFSSQAVELKAGDNSTFTELCITAASGNRAATYNAIKASGYSKTFVVNNVQCNSADMISFIQQYGENIDGMIKALEDNGTHVSIKDLAMLSRQYR